MKRKYYQFDLNVIVANILCFVIFFITFPLYFYFITKTGRSLVISDMFFLLLILMFAVHEVLHGVGFSLFVKDKSKIKYGALLEKGVFYCLSQDYVSKKGMYVSLLFPTIFLTFILLPVGIILKNDTLSMIALFNFAGAIGDFTMINLIRKMPDDIEYIDYDLKVGCTLVSSHDLSKIKGFGMKFIESGDDSKKLINKSIKKVTISKASWIILIILIILVLIPYLLPYFL